MNNKYTQLNLNNQNWRSTYINNPQQTYKYNYFKSRQQINNWNNVQNKRTIHEPYTNHTRTTHTHTTLRAAQQTNHKHISPKTKLNINHPQPHKTTIPRPHINIRTWHTKSLLSQYYLDREVLDLVLSNNRFYLGSCRDL